MAYNPICDNCPAKSADCAYGDLRGSQSCEDTRKRLEEKRKS